MQAQSVVCVCGSIFIPVSTTGLGQLGVKVKVATCCCRLLLIEARPIFDSSILKNPAIGLRLRAVSVALSLVARKSDGGPHVGGRNRE